MKKDFHACVHVRRGDYLTSGLHHASTPEDTVKIIKFLKNAYPNARILAFGNDNEWLTSLVSGLDVGVAQFKIQNPPNVDWEFSRQYCDVVALTAPTSTYGWWMAFLARGKVVYYKEIEKNSEGMESELIPNDYFLPYWTPITKTMLKSY
ncbi:hypothetical protein WR25_10557 [Diploscapter pachys]|uniref:L-Fucosyltransferase n=1 Tax=Diploscapter pachys TaxID=2018661 RepID=A0A2A2JTM5_9BILA|nr:hypothetical protein WR25_10557 [Diploscapter pachys]